MSAINYGPPLRERTRGRWRGILPALGISSKFLKRKNGPCPMCGGKDRWRFTDLDGNGTWWCNKCGGGSGTDLAMKFLRLTFRDAALRIEAVIGETRPELLRPAPNAERHAAIDRLWQQGSPIRRGDPVDCWLRARGIGLDVYPRTLRAARSLRYDAGSCHPAMLARVEALDGAATIHRTYLTNDGRKAPVDKPRKLAPGPFPKGGAVRLAPAGPTLGVSEGIESGLAAAKLFQVPTWAAISATTLMRFEPPAGIKKLIVFGDHDANGVGQESAYLLAARLASKLAIEVRIPERADADWNDVLAGSSA
jgi:putative DNA primase/helicase